METTTRKFVKVRIDKKPVSKTKQNSDAKLEFLKQLGTEAYQYPIEMYSELQKRFAKTLSEKNYFTIKPMYCGDEQSYLTGSKYSEDWYYLLNDYNTKFNNVVHSIFQEVCNTVPSEIAVSDYEFNPNLSSGRNIHYLTSQRWQSAIWRYIENCVGKYSDYIGTKSQSWDFISIDNSSTKYAIIGIRNRYDTNKQFETIQAFIWYLVVIRGEQIPAAPDAINYVTRGYYLQLLLDNANIKFELSNKIPVNHWQKFPELNKME